MIPDRRGFFAFIPALLAPALPRKKRKVTPEYPVVASTALLVPAINSPNFNLQNPAASPSPSWAILQNGLAYFFGLTLSGGTITGPDYIIDTSGIFIYSGTPAAGNLIGSWAGTGGTDAFGNVYPAGFNITQGSISGSTFDGTNFVLNSTGAFFYSGTPALNNLIVSIANTTGTDGEGNAFLLGLASYGFNVDEGSGYIATSSSGGTTNYYLATTMAGPWAIRASIQWNQVTGLLIQDASGDGAELESLNGGIVSLAATNTPQLNLDGTQIGIDGSLTDVSTINTGNVTGATNITPAYTTDSASAAATIYELYVPFNGTWGAETMAVYAVIGGTATKLCTVGAVFVPSTVSGNSVNGWLKVIVEEVTSTTARAHVGGVIENSSLNSGNITNGTACPISSAVATGLTWAPGDTLAVAISFGASAAGQNIETFGSSMTRKSSK